MSGDAETASLGRIEATRRVARKAADLCVARGASIEDAAIGMAYAAFDVAERHAGEGQGAIEWLRTSIDVLEAALIDGQRRAVSGDG